MNLLTAIIVVVVIVGLLLLGNYLRKRGQGVELFALPWAIALVLVLLLINTYLVRIPNPFGARELSLKDYQSFERPAPPAMSSTLTVPTTNADPNAAAAASRKRLEEAKSQQQNDLGLPAAK